MPREWTDTFLNSLARVPNVSAACRRAEISREAAYKRRQSDPEFAALWDTALDVSTDDLVGECYRRARDGVEKPVFYQGAECGRLREYSDTLAIFLLKAHRRETYGDVSKVHAEHSGPGGGPVPLAVDVTRMTDDQLRALVASETDIDAAGTGGGRA